MKWTNSEKIFIGILLFFFILDAIGWITLMIKCSIVHPFLILTVIGFIGLPISAFMIFYFCTRS